MKVRRTIRAILTVKNQMLSEHTFVFSPVIFAVVILNNHEEEYNHGFQPTRTPTSMETYVADGNRFIRYSNCKIFYELV